MATPRLPGWVPPTTPSYVPPRQSLSRPSATRINSTAPREVTLTISGQNEIIPVTYGEDRISGLWIVRPYTHIGTGELRFAMLWGWGPAEGVQDVYINGADVPSGVTMTHYTGEPGQGIDPTLGADIPGFGDVFEGCAYTVFRVPPATITGFPQTAQIEAVFRGRKVLDPRTNTIAWSRNPALALLDFCTDTRYGPGMPVRGIEAVADRCDSLVGGVEVRSQIGLTLTAGQHLDAWLDVLSTYAECLWSYDGDGILTVPDAPGEVAAVISRDDVVGDSWRFQGANLASAPTVVTVNWRRSTGTAEQWTDEPAIQELPGVSTGEVAEIRSDLSLPGIRRAGEANRKALTRLRRLQFPASYAWQMFDRGIVFQRGDIVQLPDTRGLNSCLVRVLSIEMVALGIYQIAAEHYDPSIYPDDIIPGEETVVPVGGGLLTLDSEAPDGWEFFHDADGYILCGGDTPGPVAGTGPVVISGVTGPSPTHTGNTGDNDTSSEAFIYGTSQAAGSTKPAVPGSAPVHDHTYTSAPITHNPAQRTYRIIKKVGAPGQIPTNAGVLSNGQLISARLSELTANLGRLVAAHSGQNSTNSGSPVTRNISITMNNAGAHDHGPKNRAADERTILYAPYLKHQHISAGNHSHNGWISVNFDTRRRRLAIYLATAETDIVVGAIILWLTDDPPPPGWYLCDGDNGTIDLRGYFIEHSSSANAGAAVGDNTAWWNTNTIYAGEHNHKGEPMGDPWSPWEFMRHARNSGGHVHPVSGSVPYYPDHYVVRFIQYTGVE